MSIELIGEVNFSYALEHETGMGGFYLTAGLLRQLMAMSDEADELIHRGLRTRSQKYDVPFSRKPVPQHNDDGESTDAQGQENCTVCPWCHRPLSKTKP